MWIFRHTVTKNTEGTIYQIQFFLRMLRILFRMRCQQISVCPQRSVHRAASLLRDAIQH